MKNKTNKLNKIYNTLKVFLVLQVFAYMFMLIFSVMIASERNSLMASIKKEEAFLATNEKDFFDKRQNIISVNKQNKTNSIVDSISTRENLVEYIYENFEQTASR